MSISDVRRKSDLADYGGELEARTTLRLTDRLSGSALNESATLGDLPFEFVRAVRDDDQHRHRIGVRDSSTSADAITPGIADEGSRAVWQLGQVSVADGGSDGLGSTDPNGVFAVQGVFVP